MGCEGDAEDQAHVPKIEEFHGAPRLEPGHVDAGHLGAEFHGCVGRDGNHTNGDDVTDIEGNHLEPPLAAPKGLNPHFAGISGQFGGGARPCFRHYSGVGIPHI